MALASGFIRHECNISVSSDPASDESRVGSSPTLITTLLVIIHTVLHFFPFSETNAILLFDLLQFIALSAFVH